MPLYKLTEEQATTIKNEAQDMQRWAIEHNKDLADNWKAIADSLKHPAR